MENHFYLAMSMFKGKRFMRAFHEITTEFTHPFFVGIKDEQLRIIAELSMLTKFDENELIFREGDSANRFYLINEGKVSLETRVEGRGMIVVDQISSGDVLGWSWLFEPYVWQFDARTLEPTTAWFVYGTRLREECEGNPELGYEVMKRISGVLLHRLQSTRRRLVYLAGLTTDFTEPQRVPRSRKVP
jgi:CRP/FNR family cyclic AMP-dependent transcriptional regulator